MHAPKDMLKLATQCMQNAYAPYSKFSVGTCIKTADGQLFGGCNIENASLSLTLCAEACALCATMSTGTHEIKEVLIISNSQQLCPPCGACRQRLYEFCGPDTIFHLCTEAGKYQQLTLNDLLPYAFSSKTWRKNDSMG